MTQGTTPDTLIQNVIFDEIAIGDTASIVRDLTQQDIELFALVSGDVNPAHLDIDYAARDDFHKIVAHGMWGGALISAVLGNKLPGPGTIYVAQELRFHAPIGIGDKITTSVTARQKWPETKRIRFDCVCRNQLGVEIITGTAEVRAPTEKICRNRIELPEIRLIPIAINYDTFAHSRDAIEVIRFGSAIRLFQAVQQASTIASYVSQTR